MFQKEAFAVGQKQVSERCIGTEYCDAQAERL